MLPRAIESVIHQSFADWELIVIDDGSTDYTRKLVQSYVDQESRVRYIYQENGERSRARNKGIREANGTYVCFLDSDDYYLPDRLEKLHQVITDKKSPLALFYTDAGLDTNGHITFSSYPSIKGSNTYDILVKRIITSQQVCAASDILKEFQFNPDITIAEDGELWMRVARKHKVTYLQNQATVVILDHADRTVGQHKPEVYLKHIQTYQLIRNLHRNVFSSPRVIKDMIHDGYMGLARSYMLSGKKYKMLGAMGYTIRYNALRNWKEKLVLLSEGFTFPKLMLGIYRNISSRTDSK